MRLEHEIDPDAWKEWLTTTPLEQIREQVEEVCNYNGSFDGFEYEIARYVDEDPNFSWEVFPLYMLDGTHKAGEIYLGKTLEKAVDKFISEELKAIDRFKR